MTIRALGIGLLLALLIAGVTYFNDWVIVQTHLVGNHLPIGVFGVVMLLLMVANPALSLLRRRWSLRPAELAVIAALGLAVCGWAGSNFFRTFVGVVGLPAHHYKNQPSWQSARVLSYVPDGSPEVAAGHVRDWPELLATLADDDANGTAGRVRARLDADARQLITGLRGAEELDAVDKQRVLNALNAALIFPTGAGDANAPLHASSGLAELPARARDALQRRREKLARAEALRAERQDLQRQLDRLVAGFGGNLQQARRRQQQLKDRAAALSQRLEDLPADRAGQAHALRAELAETQARLAEARGDAGVYEDRMAPLVRRISRAGWQLDHALARAEIFARRANRAVLAAMLGGEILPAPAGCGAYLNGGLTDAYATGTLVQGWDGDRPLGLRDLPWWVWSPTLITWGSVAILLTLAMLCIALIVHPQWSKRELLSYPIVKFLDEVTEPVAGKGLPRVMRSKLFWIGLGVVLAIHTLNGLYKWFPGYLVQIPMRLDFRPAQKLWPDALKVPGAWVMFYPTIFPCAVGFAYFLNKEVSLSVGLSVVLWAAVGVVLISNGIPIENNQMEADMSPLLRFGAYVGMLLMILYVGRSHYANVLASAIGLRRKESTPAYCTWAARGLVLCAVGAGAMLSYGTGLDALLSAMFIACVLIMAVGMARINVETGLFFVQPHWMPVGVITALLGASALGPEAIAALAIASAVMTQDPRESTMPFLANSLNLSDRLAGVSPRRSVWPIAGVIVAGFAVALTATLYWQYTSGCSLNDRWARDISETPMKYLTSGVAELEARGELSASNAVRGLRRLTHASPASDGLFWLGLGVVLVLACAAARLRLPWWPLHPVVFLIWGNWASCQLAFSFLLGWMLKVAATRLGGAKGFRAILPFMAGLIAGELLAAIGWTLVGALYYALTHTPPEVYQILPG